MLLLLDKPLLLRSLVNHSPRGRACCFPGQGMMCHLSIATAAMKDPSLVADVQSAHPNPANSTKTRSGVLPSCIPVPPLEGRADPGSQEEHSLGGLWYHRWDDVSQFGCGMGCCFWSPSPLLLLSPQLLLGR